MKRDDSSDRSALLTMSYFHSWTLRQHDAQGDHVPFAGGLRYCPTWEEYLATCLDGNVISKESARYIVNILSVYRVRQRDPNDDARSDEDVSVEEAVLTEAALEQALTIRVGRRVYR